MARLNITIPDELYRALGRWRSRVNISRVCQEAIAREVAKLEELPRAATELEALVERLRREKAGADQFWFAQGVTEAIAWTRDAPYEELRRWGEAGGEEAPRLADGCRGLQNALRRYRQDPAFAKKTYVEGWVAGAREVWQRVKDKV